MDAIIKHNSNLKEEFVNFYQNREDNTSKFLYDDYIKIVSDVQAVYKHQFETVDLENPNWDNYHPPHSGYIEDWQAYQYASEQEFDAIFDHFRSKAINKIIEQRPDELMAMLTGLYEATQDAEVLDEVSSFDDVNDHLLSEHKNIVNTIVEKLRLSALSENRISTAFNLFFRYCNEEYPGNAYFAAHFEPLLIALAEKSDKADHLLYLLDQSGVEKGALPELTLFLNKKTGNNTEWLHAALQFYRTNVPVARELLEYYFESDKDAFTATARELFPANNYLWAQFLQQYITPQLDKELFIKVFWTLTVASREIKDYCKMREYLTETDFNRLLEEIRWEKVFTVKILEVEKRYEDIKTMVEKTSENWHLSEMISPILTVYPGFCFGHIKKMAISALQNERGRHIYERIATWLKLTGNIPGFETEKQELVQQLYNHKPNLPALKDEMRKAGLAELKFPGNGCNNNN
ncbi:MAG: hypothetical protein WC384_13355 [Prolixibacteraceae bacterium]